MLRYLCIVLLLVTIVSGCEPSAKEKYDAAARDVDRAQAQLDKLRPAYDAAVVAAREAVCRDITGTTPEDASSVATNDVLQGLGDALNKSTAEPVDAAKKAEAVKKKPTGRKGDELDQVVDNLDAAVKDAAAKQAALTAPLAKATAAREVMNKIKTPGTPEAKKVEEKLAGMDEVKAYERQKKRLERAQQEMDDAEKEYKK